MTEKELFPPIYTGKEKKESILRHILKVKDEVIELPEEVILTDRIDCGSSCETITLDDEFTPRIVKSIFKGRRENFSDDSLEDSVNSTEGVDKSIKEDQCNLIGSSTSTCLNSTAEKTYKKPSMIPKLSRNNKTNLPEQKYVQKNDCKTRCQNGKTNVKGGDVQTNAPPPVKLTNLQQKLKTTTSIIKQKIDSNSLKENMRNKSRYLQSNSQSVLIGQEKPQNSLATLYRNIVQMRETVVAISKHDTFKNQKCYVEKLFRLISEIQNVSDKLAEIERKQDRCKSKLQCW